MALIECKECGHEVSKKADKCPNCGAPIKKQTSGCAMLFAIIGGVMLFTYFVNLNDSSSTANRQTEQPRKSASPKKEWYSGGNLHKATLDEWRKASNQNRLATSSDFIAAVSKDVGWLSTDEIKPLAVELMSCIDSTAGDSGLDNMHVSEVAAACLVMLWPEGIKRK